MKYVYSKIRYLHIRLKGGGDNASHTRTNATISKILLYIYISTNWYCYDCLQFSEIRSVNIYTFMRINV